MFKEAKAGPRKAITANRLSDGLVVFLSETGDWSLSVDDFCAVVRRRPGS